jgi:hypothetical protein
MVDVYPGRDLAKEARDEGPLEEIREHLDVRLDLGVYGCVEERLHDQAHFGVQLVAEPWLELVWNEFFDQLIPYLLPHAVARITIYRSPVWDANLKDTRGLEREAGHSPETLERLGVAGSIPLLRKERLDLMNQHFIRNKTGTLG